MAKAYTWHQQLPITAGVTAVLKAGGSLSVGTTYYYRIIAVDNAACIIEQVADDAYGQPSVEVSATPTAGNQIITLSWGAVAGAAAYYVYRSTTADTYSGSKRFRRLSDNGSNYPTLTGLTMDDAGSYNFKTTSSIALMPAGSKLINGLDMTLDYGGYIDISGGTSGDVITLGNIYDWMVINVANYQKYVYYDGFTFTLMGGVNFNTGVETHFLAKNRVIILCKTSNLYNTTSGSNIQFGELDASGMAKNGVRIMDFGSYYARPLFSTGAKAYATKAITMIDDSEWTQGTNRLIGSRECNCRAVTDSKDFSIENYYYISKYGDTPMVDLKLIPTIFSQLIHHPNKLSWRMKSSKYYSCQYGANEIYRLDEFTTYATTYQYAIRNYPCQLLKIINPICPNSTDSEKLPTFYFFGADGEVKIYFGFLLKIMDGNNNSISGATISIKDTNGSAGQDYDDVGITDYTTDADGMLLREKITITSVSASTVTDSSKSWTVDEWKGRNVYVNTTREILKIKSNTATVITFISDFLSQPSVGARVGIIAELLRFSETQAGKTDYSPFTLTISKAGYEVYEKEFTLDEKINWRIDLSPARVHIDQECLV